MKKKVFGGIILILACSIVQIAVAHKQNESVIGGGIVEQYDWVWPECEGMIGVKQGDKWAYFDNKGNNITGFVFEEVLPFEESVARVKKDDMWAIIDKKGKNLCDFKYQEIQAFKEGIAVIKRGYASYGFLKQNGEELVPCKFVKAYPFIKGYALAIINIKEDNRSQNNVIHLDVEGKEYYFEQQVYANKYDVFQDLPAYIEDGIVTLEELELVEKSDGDRENYLEWETYIRYYDLDGNLVEQNEENKILKQENAKALISGEIPIEIIKLENKYSQIYTPGDKRYVAVKEDKYGLLDERGNTIIPFHYEYIGWSYDLDRGIYSVKKDGQVALFNRKGQAITDFLYQAIDVNDIGDGLIPAIKNGFYGYINLEGKEVIPFQYNAAGRFSDDRALVHTEKGQQYIDSTGKIITLLKFYDGTDFKNGMAIIEVGEGTYHYINKEGIIVAAYYDAHWDGFRYNTPSSYNEDGIAFVTKGGYENYIDKEGNKLFAEGYRTCNYLKDIGVIIVSKNDKYGIYNINNEEIIPYVYDDICMEGYDLTTKEAILRVERGGQYGLIKMDGSEILPTSYDVVGDYNTYNDLLKFEFICVEKDNQYGLIDTTGKFIIPLQGQKITCDRELGIYCKQNNQGENTWFDQDGKIIKNLEGIEWMYQDDKGGIYIYKDGKEGYLDKNYKVMIPLVYDSIYENGTGCFVGEQDGMYSLIYVEGES